MADVSPVGAINGMSLLKVPLGRQQVGLARVVTVYKAAATLNPLYPSV